MPIAWKTPCTFLCNMLHGITVTFCEKSACFTCISATMLSARGGAYLLVHKIEWCYSVNWVAQENDVEFLIISMHDICPHSKK